MNKLLMVLSSAFALSACVEVPKTLEHDSRLEFTEVSGYKFHTQVKGDLKAPVVIVVHGGPGADHQYLLPMGPLAKAHRVIFYDQRGSGLSPRVDKSQLTLEQNLKDLDLLVEHFSADRKVTLIGHSWGGMLVAGYLSTYPTKVSHAVLVEPGMLHPEAAAAFVKTMKAHQSIGSLFSLAKYMSVYPFVRQHDGHEGFDYVMTKLLNKNDPGAPYQCAGESMPDNSFTRASYEAFNSMLKPVMDDPASFRYDLSQGIESYTGKLMLISSECSAIGYAFQEQYHMPKLPQQTRHVKANKMGHNMLTLNPEWSLSLISSFLNE
ncbi:alpha/beta hydrolase [Alginatibacterium sediminis]|uniref:Alpha/beta hydrolase n=1 Tax=Alginatibacterium sediminis TaxID=2164068 RepID=A0A420EDG4_9ALTE|nr:alpha/beta hydrolase [Alginatibacterium sediminis]RKF18710.1 alpha/beta hydrolase [Alginatibacterium sediminis]